MPTLIPNFLPLLCYLGRLPYNGYKLDFLDKVVAVKALEFSAGVINLTIMENMLKLK
jgi:hypothetical protein